MAADILPNGRYTAVAAILHWLTVLAIFVLIAVGWWMTSIKDEAQHDFKMQLYTFHKSLGLTVLLLAVLRILWRLGHKPPPLPAHMPAIQKFAAEALHFGFYVMLIALPVSGWVFNDAVEFPLPFWGIGDLPDLYRWDDAAKTAIIFGFIPVRGVFADSVQAWQGMQAAHKWLGYLLMVMIVMHVGAALKHTFVDKDNLLLRMVPRFRRD
jgi:cytochrome b561